MNCESMIRMTDTSSQLYKKDLRGNRNGFLKFRFLTDSNGRIQTEKKRISVKVINIDNITYKRPQN